MKQTLAISIIFIILLGFFSPSAKGNAQITSVDSIVLVDSVALRDSIAQALLFSSLSPSFKYSEIINYPKKNSNFVQLLVDSTLKKGKHDLIFDLQGHQSNEGEKTAYLGETKGARPVWVVFVVGFIFLALGVVKIAFPVELKIIVDAYYKERVFQQVSKEDNLATSWPYIFLYALFSLALGLFVCILVSNFTDKNYLTFENFLKNASFVAILFIAKILLIRFVAYIFQLEKIVREYIAVLYLLYFNSFFFLMPFLLAVLFLPTIYFQYLIIVYGILIIILFAYRFVRTAFHLFGHFQFSIFYLILYLCSLEIAPILILVRALNN